MDVVDLVSDDDVECVEKPLEGRGAKRRKDLLPVTDLSQDSGASGGSALPLIDGDADEVPDSFMERGDSFHLGAGPSHVSDTMDGFYSSNKRPRAGEEDEGEAATSKLELSDEQKQLDEACLPLLAAAVFFLALV